MIDTTNIDFDALDIPIKKNNKSILPILFAAIGFLIIGYLAFTYKTQKDE